MSWNHLFATASIGKRLVSVETSLMRFQAWRFIRPILSGCCHSFSNTSGRAAYWLIAALLLLVTFSWGAVLYRASGIADEWSQPIIALDRRDARKPPQLYKIAMPIKTPALTHPGVSPDAVGPETKDNQAAVSSEKGVDDVRLSSPANTGDQRNKTASPGPGKRPDERVETDKKALQKETALVSGVTVKAEKPSSREGETSSPGTEGGMGKRFFVKVDVGNVRDAPSMTSAIKFRVKNGESLTVTDTRGGWYAVKLDDGRSGWVFQTLLADSLVPQTDETLAMKEVRTIRPETPANDVAKVVFELNGPYPPQTTITGEGKPRIVCDFYDAKIAPDIGDRIEVNNGFIERIRIGMHKWPKLKVRVVLDLVPGRDYTLERSLVDKENCYVLEVAAK